MQAFPTTKNKTKHNPAESCPEDPTLTYIYPPSTLPATPIQHITHTDGFLDT